VLTRLPRAVAVAVMAVALLLNLPHTEPKGYLTFDDEYYAPASIAALGINTTTREEYEPRWVVERPPRGRKGLTGVTAAIEILSSTVGSARQQYTVRAGAATEVEAATFFYPGWRVTVDGAQVELAAVPGRGTMTFPIPAGEHCVVLALGPTPVRRVAWAMSVVTLALLALFFFSLRRLEPPGPSS